MRRTAGAAKSFVTAIFVLAVVALVGLLVVLPRLTGSAALTVLSGSMEPTIPVGSVVLIKPIDPLAVQPGDVITFQAAPGVKEVITHRVVRFQPDTTPPSFITKGDANKGEDIDPVPVGAVRGEVWFHVPYVGNVSELVQGPQGWAALALLSGVLLLAHLLGKLVGGRKAPAAPRAEAA